VRFEVLVAQTVMMAALWDGTVCSPVEVCCHVTADHVRYIVWLCRAPFTSVVCLGRGLSHKSGGHEEQAGW